VNHTFLRAMAGAFALLVTSAAGAAGVVIDTPQKAAAAAITAHAFFLDPNPNFTLPRQIELVTVPSRQLVHASLGVLASATTPDALANARGGGTFACSDGGSLHAQLARAEPVILKFTWIDCKQSLYGGGDDSQYRQTFNGTGSVELAERTFTPTVLKSLRLGTAAADVTSTVAAENEYSTTFSTTRMNVRMSGEIPMTEWYTGYYVGEFNFYVSGLWDNVSVVTTHILDIPPDTATYENSFVLDQLGIRGATLLDVPGNTLDEDLFVERGTITMTWVNNAWPRPGVYTISPRNLHLRSLTDYATSTIGKTLDGRADVTWPASTGPGCLSGTYVFRTDQLIEAWNGWGTVYKAGGLNINGALTSTYSTSYTSPPMSYPPAPTGAVQLKLRSAAGVPYPYEWNPSAGLNAAAQCFN
jgi:hypothetical protein